MRFNRREVILFLILIIIGAGVVFYQFFYLAQQKEIDGLKAELETSSQKFAQSISKQEDIEGYMQKIRDLDLEINSLERKVPYTMDIPGMMVEFYHLIRENGLEGKNISFSKVTEGTAYNYFNISFEVKGSKDNVYNFLYELENYKRKLSVDMVTINAGGDPVISMSLSLKVFLQKNAQAGTETVDYDFMQGSYGTFNNLFDMFRN